MTETIQQLKKDIAILQEKLRKKKNLIRVLEEKEPEMLLLRQGKVDFVDYDGKDGKKYIRIEYTDSFADDYIWYVRRVGEDAIRPVRDVNVYAPLEELYQKEVVKQKDDYPYKKYTPEETEKGLRNAMRTAKKEGVFDKPKESWMDKPIDELVAILEKNPPECLKFQLGKTLEQLIERWWCDVFSGPHENWSMEECISDLCDRIFLWLPKEQDSSGTQRIETIVAVDTHNELLRKIKSKIHNKKDT